MKEKKQQKLGTGGQIMARYIDAKELEKQVRKRINNGAIRGWLLSMINKCPAADVEPVRHGKWIEELGMNEKCSVCGKHFPLLDFVGRPFDINYCPNCGAKMDKEDK